MGWGHPAAELGALRKPQGAWLPWTPALAVYSSPTRPKEPGSFPHVPAPLSAPRTLFIYKVFIANE